jgi:cell division protein FtsA
VCVGGRTIKVVPVSSTRDQIRKRPVTPALLEEMEWECKEKIERKYPNLQVLDLVPYYYKLDGDEQDEAPKPWQETMLLEAHFMAFVGMREHEERVKGSFDRSTVQLEHAYARPDALLNALASDDDMKEGCAILDLGAQTTTLSVFKGTQYLDTQVVPLGGFDISEAITELGISMKYAEYLKELVIKIVRAHPEVNSSDVYVSKDDNGHMCLFYNRYMTDEELEQYNAKLKELEEEVEHKVTLDD